MSVCMCVYIYIYICMYVYIIIQKFVQTVGKVALPLRPWVSHWPNTSQRTLTNDRLFPKKREQGSYRSPLRVLEAHRL